MAPFATKIPVAVKKDDPAKPPRDSKIAESTRPAKSSSSIDVQRAAQEAQEAPLPTPPPEPIQSAEAETAEPPSAENLSEEHVRTLFSGAPNFFVQKTGQRPTPRVSYPWDVALTIKDVSDSVQLAEPAYSAATLHKHLPVLQQASDQHNPHKGYDVDVAEVPSMAAAQGIEPVRIHYVSDSVMCADETCFYTGNRWICTLPRATAIRSPCDRPPTITVQ